MKKLYFLLSVFILAGSYSFSQEPTTSFDVNGIKVIFKPTLKDIINVRVYFRGGVTNYSPDKSGIERLTLASVIQCGTQKYEADKFRDMLDKYSVVMRYGTEYDYGDIEMECVNKFFNTGWSLLSDAIMSPAFNSGQVDLEKNKIISSIRQSESNPDDRAEQLILKNAFEGTPYEANPDGLEDVIKKLTPGELKDYYQKILNKNQIFIVVAGKIDRADLIAKINASFKNMPSVPYSIPTYKPKIWDDNKLLMENRSLSTNYINAIFNTPLVTDNDFIAFRLGNMALGGRLYNALRTRLNLSYAPGALLSMKQMPYGLMYVSTNNPKEAVEQMVKAMGEYKRNQISEHWLQNLKSGFYTSYYMKKQTTSSITANLGLFEILGDWHISENLPSLVQNTTTEQIYKAANKYIIGLRWSYLGDENLANKAKDAFNMKIDR